MFHSITPRWKSYLEPFVITGRVLLNRLLIFPTSGGRFIRTIPSVLGYFLFGGRSDFLTTSSLENSFSNTSAFVRLSFLVDERSTKQTFLALACSFEISCSTEEDDDFSKILGRFLVTACSFCLFCSLILSPALWIISRMEEQLRCKGLSGKYACAIGWIRNKVVRVTAGSCQLLKATRGVRLSPNTSYSWWYSWFGLLALEELDLQNRKVVILTFYLLNLPLTNIRPWWWWWLEKCLNFWSHHKILSWPKFFRSSSAVYVKTEA